MAGKKKKRSWKYQNIICLLSDHIPHLRTHFLEEF